MSSNATSSSLPLLETDATHENAGIEATRNAAEAQWQVVMLDIHDIAPSPYQPREFFDPTELEELARSVKAYGVQQPILVRPKRVKDTAHTNGSSANGESAKGSAKKRTRCGKTAPEPRYELVAGERRWRASQLAGRKTVPAFVRELSDLAAAEIAVIENVQRANLSVIEEARGYKQLALKFRLKEERIAKKVGKSVATIRDTLRLLALPPSVQTLLAKRTLSAAHGHELLRLASQPRVCESVALRAVRDKITAISLAGNILPHAAELKRAGLLTELGYGTKFDWRSVCKTCPHKAFVSVGYQSYCLRPDEWKRKQEEALALQREEAARVLEEARQQNQGTLERDRLAQVRHRSLLGVTPPAGCCETCPCRSETFDEADPMRRIPLCLDPDRFEALRDAQREAELNARKERYLQEWQNAMQRLRGEEVEEVTPKAESSSEFSPSEASPNEASRLAALLVWPILRGDYRSTMAPNTWHEFVAGIAAQLEIALDCEKLLDRRLEHFQGLQTLAQMPSRQLLLLGAGLLLGQEAERTIRFQGETPQLDFVLRRAPATQTQFDEFQDQDEDPENQDSENEDDDFGDEKSDTQEHESEDRDSEDRYSEDRYPELAETEAEVEEH